MPVPQTKLFLANALATGRALRFLPNAAGDFSNSLTGGPVAPWLAVVGDLNADGRADFIFGAPGDDDKFVDAGRIFVSLDAYAGGTTNPFADGIARMIIDGVNAGDRAGAAVGSIADLNGDGLAEILVGAPGMENGALTDAGAAFVVWGANGATGVDLNDVYNADADGFAIKGEAGGDAAGTTILSIADLNGDGKADILVGAPGNDAGGSNAGATYVIWGKNSLTSVELSSVAAGVGGFKIIGDSGNDAAGSVIGTVADQNGDGKAEILIGTPESALGGANSGAVFVVFGKATGTAVDLTNVAAGIGGYVIKGVAGDNAGAAISGLGDVNGDGRADILVGAPQSNSAYVVFGKTDTAAVDLANVALGTGGFKIIAEAAGDLDSLSVTGGADLNGDGISDLVIGASKNSEGGSNAGAVYVVWGGGSGTVDLALVAQGIGGAKVVGSAGSLTGASVAIAGDLNGDGKADLLIGAPGTGESAYVLYADPSWQPDTNIYGTAGNDVIDVGYGGAHVVGAAADAILGLAGNDTIHGGGGNDIIEGGAGNDSLFGDDGNDTLDGGTGNDAMAGGTGDDIFIVDSTLDTVTELAGEGIDTVLASVSFTLGTNVENLTLTAAGLTGTGNADANLITGSSGNDTLDGGAGADTLVGGLGNDNYKVDNAGDIVTEAASGGTDTVTAAIDFTLGANVENLILTGAARIGTGNALNNSLVGTAFNDTLDGGAGVDVLAGGLGDDTYVVDTATDTITEAAGAGTDTVVSSVNLALAANVENLALTGAARIGTGNALNNSITGTAFNDTLDGGAGADTLTGGLGDDTYLVDSIGDVIVELAGQGNDTVIAAFDYTLGTGSIENLTLTGAAHIGTGNAGDNVITGGAGNDTLDGGGGIDTLVGGLGDDTYVVDTTTDTITELAGGGADTVLASVNYTLGAELENLVLSGGATIGTGNALDNALTGGAGADTLSGLGGNDVLNGGAGADVMIGGIGDDTYFIDNVGDIVTEVAGEGTDTVVVSSDWTLADNIENVRLSGTGHTLTGNAANNTLEGDTGDDTLDGGDGDDVEIGGDGDDRLISSSGHDTLAGGAGDDVYVLSGGSAHIEDFLGHDTVDASDASGDSHIDLSGETQTEVEGQLCDFGTGGTITGSLNVQFLQDLTGSFADDITTVRSLVPQIVTALQSVQADAAFGVSTFRDKAIGSFGSAGDWVYRTENAIGITPAALTAAYSAMVAGGGNDLPESQLEALMQLGLRAGGEVGFQTNAARIVVLFTDASFHVAGDGAAAGILTANNGDAILDGNGIGEDYPMIGQVQAALAAANIIPIFAVTAGLETTYQGLVTALARGTVVTLTANSSNIVTAITNGLTTATTTHIAAAIGGAGHDTLIGNVGDNSLTGNGGNDTLTGEAGNDALYGGTGIDTAVFSGTRADYTVTLVSATSVIVTDLRGIDDTDTLTDVEFLRFSDVTIPIDGTAPVNTAPTAAALATSVVAENAALGTVIGTVVGSDPDAGDVLSYSLVNDAGGRFAIDAATGVLTVTGGAPIDFEVAASHGISVRITDLAGASSDFAFAIDVTNVNDLAPVFSSAAALALAENGTAVGTVVAADPDGLAAVGYAISGGADAALFTIDAATGLLSFVAAPDFEAPLDAGADNLYDLEVTASDGGLASVLAISVAVTNVVEAPTKVFTGTSLVDSFAVADGNGWTISGLAGNDTLTGGAREDIITGGRGNDILAGGAGNDVFKFAAGDGYDSYDGGSGSDRITATSINAVIGISALVGIEAIDAGGFANVSILGTSAAQVLDFSAVTLTGIVKIDAGSGNDSVTGSTGADTIALGSGNDIFHAGEGDDVFLAKASTGVDTIDGGGGVDTIRAIAANFSLNITGMSSIEAIDSAGFAGMKLVGGSLADAIDLSAVTLTGIAGISGMAGNDSVTGSVADDVISGGTGRDVLTGGAGADVFAYLTASESGVGATRADHITDFLSGSDRIDLSAIDADALVVGNQAFAFIGTAAFTGLGQLRIGTDVDGHVALFGNTAGNLNPDFQISFDNNAPLVVTDFVL